MPAAPPLTVLINDDAGSAPLTRSDHSLTQISHAPDQDQPRGSPHARPFPTWKGCRPRHQIGYTAPGWLGVGPADRATNSPRPPTISKHTADFQRWCGEARSAQPNAETQICPASGPAIPPKHLGSHHPTHVALASAGNAYPQAARGGLLTLSPISAQHALPLYTVHSAVQAQSPASPHAPPQPTPLPHHARAPQPHGRRLPLSRCI